MMTDDLLGGLNEEQRAVVLGGDGYALVLAGAGSGKTRTIIYRVAYLLGQGVKPEEILLLTFTNKAAKEMINRLQTILGDRASGVQAGTFHSWCNRLLRREQGASFGIFDEDDALELMKMAVKESGFALNLRKFPAPALLKAINSYAANTGLKIIELLADKYSSWCHIGGEIEEVLQRYRSIKISQQGKDFDDLLTDSLALLEGGSTERISGGLLYVLVDEYQDTNLVQARLVKLLASVHKNLLVVGDDAQSIYSFRAAEVKNILEFQKEYPGAKIFKLVVNYRSTPEILAVANELLDNNPGQFQKDLKAVLPSGERPRMVDLIDDRAEAKFLTQAILREIQEGRGPSEIAVLFRAAYHSQYLEFELTQQGVAYDYRGGLRFFDRAHIKDAVCVLRLLGNHKDLLAWTRILRWQAGVGPATAGKMGDWAISQVSLQACLEVSVSWGKKADLGWQRAKMILKQALAAPDLSASLRALTASVSYREYLVAQYPNAEDRFDDLEQFARFCQDYPDLDKLLEAVTLTGEWEGGEKAARRQYGAKVVLSTIHQAKGLEWESVYLIHLAEGYFPHPRAFQSDLELSEERRLLYVAVTRAKLKLTITYPTTSTREEFEYKRKSIFLEELSPSLFKQGERFSVPNMRGKNQFLGNYGLKSLGMSGAGESTDGFWPETTIDQTANDDEAVI